MNTSLTSSIPSIQPHPQKRSSATPLNQPPSSLLFGRERDWILPDKRLGALNSCCESGDVELLKDLIEYVKEGVFDLNGHPDDGGWEPVHYATRKNHLNWLKVYHEEGGGDLWVKGGPEELLPIDIAKKHNFTEIVKYLEAQHAKGNVNPSEKKKKSIKERFRRFCLRLIQGLNNLMETLERLFPGPYRWLKKLINPLAK